MGRQEIYRMGHGFSVSGLFRRRRYRLLFLAGLFVVLIPALSVGVVAFARGWAGEHPGGLPGEYSGGRPGGRLPGDRLPGDRLREHVADSASDQPGPDATAELARVGASETQPASEAPRATEAQPEAPRAAEAPPAPDSPQWRVQNPYDGVDWHADRQYKANFHTHTTKSDGLMNPHAVVDAYYQLGYDVLSITDHDEVTYPWTAFSTLEPSSLSAARMLTVSHIMPSNLMFQDRVPEELGMIAIQGNELSMHHHMGSFFSDHRGTTTVSASLEAIAARDGLAMLFHPGRYTRPTEWHVELYRANPHLVGLEVYNQGDRYPNDRSIWDSILTQTMPERPVWGYSNDDSHQRNQIGRNWNMLILPELSAAEVRRAMESGLSYYVYAPGGHTGPAAPVIHAVQVDESRGTIEITATGHDSAVWISDGELVELGATLRLYEHDDLGPYVRAELHGPGGTVVGTQPFGLP